MPAQKTPTEGTEGLILIDVFPRAHDTSYIDNPSVRSVPIELAALVRAVCREFGLDHDELAEALDAARCDPAAAWLSYRQMAAELSIDLSPEPPQPVLAVGDRWSFIPAQAQRRKP